MSDHAILDHNAGQHRKRFDPRCVICQYERRQPAPVADHAFEGDGYDNPSICSCGRYREEHLRFR